MNFLEVSMLIGSVVMFTFAIQLFTNPAGNLLLNKLLGVFFLSRCIQNLLLFIIYIPTDSNLIFIYPIFGFFLFLSPPAIYLYTRSFINDSSTLKIKDALHLIPAVFVFINLIPLLSTFHPAKTDLINSSVSNGFMTNIQTSFISARFQFVLRTLIQLVYMVFTLQIARKFLLKKDEKIKTSLKFHLLILLGLYTLILIILIVASMELTIMNQSLESLVLKSWLSYGNSFYAFGIIFWFIRHPVILYGNLNLGPNTSKENVKAMDNNQVSSSENILSNTLIDSSLDVKITKQVTIIEKLMMEKKPFLDPEFDLEALSDLMNMPVHHCSYF